MDSYNYKQGQLIFAEPVTGLSLPYLYGVPPGALQQPENEMSSWILASQPPHCAGGVQWEARLMVGRVQFGYTE